jgi:hypothetical protein
LNAQVPIFTGPCWTRAQKMSWDAGFEARENGEFLTSFEGPPSELEHWMNGYFTAQETDGK